MKIWTKYHEKGYLSGLEKSIRDLQTRLDVETDSEKKAVIKDVMKELRNEIAAREGRDDMDVEEYGRLVSKNIDQTGRLIELVDKLQSKIEILEKKVEQMDIEKCMKAAKANLEHENFKVEDYHTELVRKRLTNEISEEVFKREALRLVKEKGSQKEEIEVQEELDPEALNVIKRLYDKTFRELANRSKASKKNDNGEVE